MLSSSRDVVEVVNLKQRWFGQRSITEVCDLELTFMSCGASNKQSYNTWAPAHANSCAASPLSMPSQV